MKLLLKLVPLKDILKFAWSIMDPVLQKKISQSKSKIDDDIYYELQIIILKLINGV